jgi:hypothetical protein
MDVLKALRELYLEKSRLDRLIAICESKIKEQDRRLSRSKRGRKSMSPEERKIVSERMRTYWAKRRTGKDDDAGTPGEPPEDTRGDAQSSKEAVEADQSARAATSS